MYKLNSLLFFCSFTIVTVCSDTPVVNNNYCIIHEPVLKLFSYNLTNLSNPQKDIILYYDDLSTSVRLQLCMPLKQKCNGKDGYSVCLVKNKEEKGIGKMPPKVDIQNGRILIIFTGDECEPDRKYIVNIVMKCDYEAGNSSYPELFHTLEFDHCTIHMIWKTALACGPRTVQNCTVISNGLHYDLSPLTRYSQNYVIHMGHKASSRIILNVCHSVIFEYNMLCQLKSGVCLAESANSRYTNLGEVQHPPFMEDDQLKLEYQDGDICKERNVAAAHIKTSISFICDYEAVDSIPEYIGGKEICHYQLIWKTAAACSIESLHSHSATTAGNCTVNNPLTKFTYDLRFLMNRNFYTVAKNGIEYKLGVCKPLVNTGCIPETGVCLTKNGTSMGRANANLVWDKGGPYLNYTDGDICENGRHYTTIAFVCGAEGTPDKPVLMEQNLCQSIIHWNTDLVCEKRVKCATDDGEINLSSLIRSTSNYIVKVNKTEFHINICRPLVPVSGLTCTHGTGVCKTSLSSDGEYINEVSLGFPKEDPTLNEKHETVLRYIDGSVCPEKKNKLISSNFTFPCDYNSKGFPEFKRYEDCTYIFEWKTSITCGAAMGNWSAPCIIRDQLLLHECNLSLLHKNQKVYNVQNKHGKEYSISICGQSYCDGSAVCQENIGYGSLTNVIFDYGRNVIKLQYNNGGKCANSSYTSEVRFICNESVGIGTPKLLWESPCSAEFEWHTNVTCNCHSSTQHPTTFPNAHESVQAFSTSHAGTVAGILLTVIALVAALLYFRDPDKRACLRSCCNPFSSRRGSGRVQYCRVDTTEEARLLLDVDPTQCQSDSDDDLLNA